jgi:predicted phage terminase large subunit-like protein
MAASYSKDLAVRASQDCRLVLESEWYKELFSRTIIAEGQDTKTKFMTTERGFRFSTSVGGMATGEGGNYLIVDDPTSALQGFSKRFRDRANTWFDQVFSNRLNDKVNGVIIVVMQRLHENDLSGYLLEKGGWEHLKIPLEQVAKTYIFPHSKKEKKVQDGELLHEARMGAAEIEREKVALTPYGWAGQYQQEPAPLGGGVFKDGWFVPYSVVPEDAIIVQSWDTASKEEELNDPSACTTWAISGNRYYLIDVFVGRLDYPKLKAKTIMHAAEFDASLVLIEDKSSGQSLIQDLRANCSFAVQPINPQGSKLTRAHVVSSIICEGRVLVPSKKTNWFYTYMAEMLTFPSSDHFDQVDSTTQFLSWASRTSTQQQKFGVRSL